MREIEQILSFIVEIEKLKSVNRKTKPVGLDRYENSAEHSWHVCLTALMFKEFANEPIHIDRVIKMLLIHDLGEIDAGDTIVYSQNRAQINAKESAGMERLTSLLPQPLGEELKALWLEFEEGNTSDARYAKAIDRVPPLLHNLYGDGHSWRAHNIGQEQILTVNSKIAAGSSDLWQIISSKLKLAFDQGILKESPDEPA